MPGGEHDFRVTEEEVQRTGTAGGMFRGSRDFFLAYELLGAFAASPDARAGRAPSPIQSQATCAAMALELALKCRIVLDGCEAPPSHSYVVLFRTLSQGAQEEIASLLTIDNQPATVATLLDALKDFEGTFQQWRYMHENLGKRTITFHEGNMIATMHAIYQSIIRLRPDFAPWPGVIVDPNDPGRWHLSPT
jgi:hypothetical protein